MPDQVDRVIQALELRHQPGRVLVHRRAEPLRADTVEPGQPQGHGIGTVDRSQQAAPDGGSLRHPMDEDGGHGSILAQRTRRPPRQRSRPSPATRVTTKDDHPAWAA
jgi:hypothetical protein